MNSPYTGLSRKLVLALDIGTTHTKVSYSILTPGLVSEIGHVGSSSKDGGNDFGIPTIIAYDADHEASTSNVLPFKLQTTPQSKTAVDSLAKYMRHLFERSRMHICEAQPGGAKVWRAMKHDIEVVLTYPDHWTSDQKAQLLEAALLAKFVPDTAEGRSRLHLVAESDARLAFCVKTEWSAAVLEDECGVLVVDAGGYSIHLSEYGRGSDANGSRRHEEIFSSERHSQGSAFVTQRARRFMAVILHNSPFKNSIDTLTNSFDIDIKPTFRDVKAVKYIRFGSGRDHNPWLNIHRGHLKLLGHEIAALFEPCISCIMHAILRQRIDAKKPLAMVLLVGGFASNEWLFDQLRYSIEPLGLVLYRPIAHTHAIADGAISFYLNDIIRIANFSYGIKVLRSFDPEDPEHIARSHEDYTSPTGEKQVGDAFDIILPKGHEVQTPKEFRKSCYRHYLRPPIHISVEVLSYRGSSTHPKWTEAEPDMYHRVCVLSATLMAQRKFQKRSKYYMLDHDVILTFGPSEFKAQIAWMEDGVEKRTEAYDILE